MTARRATHALSQSGRMCQNSAPREDVSDTFDTWNEDGTHATAQFSANRGFPTFLAVRWPPNRCRCRAGGPGNAIAQLGRAGNPQVHQGPPAARRGHAGHALQRPDGDCPGKPRRSGGHRPLLREEHRKRLRGAVPGGRFEPRPGARGLGRKHHAAVREGDCGDHRSLRRGDQRLHVEPSDRLLHRLSRPKTR